MRYAAENKISFEPLEGGIAITDQQYKEALEQMMQGKSIRINEGELIYVDENTLAPQQITGNE